MPARRCLLSSRYAGSNIVQGPSNRAPSPPAPHTSRWRPLVWGAFTIVGAAAIGFLLGPYISPQPAATTPPNKAAPHIVEGDGVNGPGSMVWIPGGEFLMGSDHELARPNERPTHRVRVAGF